MNLPGVLWREEDARKFFPKGAVAKLSWRGSFETGIPEHSEHTRNINLMLDDTNAKFVPESRHPGMLLQ